MTKKQRLILTAAGGLVLVLVVLVIGLASGFSADNYCLLNVSNNDAGTSGVLAVPQSNATQSVCDSVANNFQVNWDQGTGGNGASLVIYDDKPGFLTTQQQQNSSGTLTGDPSVLILSGNWAG